MNQSEDGVNYTQKPAKILIIDKQESARSLLKRRLSIYGHEVFSAADYRQAMKELASKAIDIIFLNMFIGRENSYNFLKELKEDNAYRNIPIIMISSDDDVELVVKCIEAGAEDYLVKPLNQTLLRARLTNCIARKEAYDKEIAYLAQIERGQKQIQAQEKMASLGELVSSISRELKNPLNFVINFAQVSTEICGEIVAQIDSEKPNIPSGFYQFLSEQLERFSSNVNKIYEYGQTADKIIRFMLDQSNTSDGTKHPANVNKVISQTVTMLMSGYKANGVTSLPKIDLELDESMPHIAISIQSFSRAIYNLLDNSVDSVLTKHKEIEHAKIIVSTENQQDTIVVSVYDNGMGIKEEIRSKIFEPFFTTKRGDIHTGLGLSTVQEIVNNNGGSVSCESTEGEYTKFRIIINK